MELPESIEALNKRLVEHFGIDTISADPIYRIVWSNFQHEKRLTQYTSTGVALLYPEVREMPKYQYIDSKYILERLTVVPAVNQDELTTKISYEPIYVYEDRKGNYLPPLWQVTKLVIDALNAAMGQGTLRHYTNPEDTSEGAMLEKVRRVKEIEEGLFGNETDITDALYSRSGVVGFHELPEVAQKRRKNG